MSIVVFILLAVGIISFLAALISLIFPKIAFFLRSPGRFKAFASYFILSFVCFIAGASLVPENKREKAFAENRVKREEIARQKHAERQRLQNLLIPYMEEEYQDTSFAGRKRARVWINLADPVISFTPEQLTATCMAAAKYYANKNGLQALSVFVSDIPGQQPWEGTRLAQCDYSPDKKGFSGNDSWEWSASAVKRPLSDAEREMKKLWGEARAAGIKTEREAITYVAKKMGIKPEAVTLIYVLPDPIKSQDFINISAKPPIN